MSQANGCKLWAAFILVAVVSGCAGSGGEAGLRYPLFNPEDYKDKSNNCEQLDHYLRQVDAIRWSMRQDGVELETDFEQVVQLSIASVAAIAIAVPMVAVGAPEPNLVAMPYSIAYTEPDNLKRADALLIALLAKRHELQCPPHPECAINSGKSDTLSQLLIVKMAVDSGEMAEQRGLDELTSLLDGLCPVSQGLSRR